jgi:hypothetical protein
MPRDGAGVYSRPAGIDAVTDTTIESAKYNLNVQDVETDLNTPRPISSGGTGASNAVDAIVALGGEIANQGDVRNFATFPFKSGSFFASPGATDTPEGAGASANWFEGICYTTNLAGDFFLEARTLATNTKYLRRKAGGVWQAWVRDDPSDKVDRAGDTMSGNLTISKGTPTLFLDKASATGGDVSQIVGTTAGSVRWIVRLGNEGAEAADFGNDFSILRYGGANTYLDTPLTISRGNSLVTLTGQLQVNAGITANGNIQAKGGTLFFQTGGQNLRFDAGVGYYTLDGGALQLNGALTTTGALATTSIAASGDITANGNIQAKGGVYFFQDGGKQLKFDPSGFFALVGGGLSIASNLSVTAAITAGSYIQAGGVLATTAGSVHSRAPVGNNSRFELQDEAAGLKGSLVWVRSSNVMQMNFQGSGIIAINSIGVVSVANGMYGRAGYAGAYDTNAHNFYWTGSAAQVWIDSTNVGTLTITCDYRIKKDVAPLASTWDAVKALKPISYTQAEFTSPSTRLVQAEQARKAREADPKAQIEIPPPTFVADDIVRWGFIAHELQETLLPSAATGEKDSPVEVQSPNLMAICAALTKALQEAMARIEALEAA